MHLSFLAQPFFLFRDTQGVGFGESVFRKPECQPTTIGNVYIYDVGILPEEEWEEAGFHDAAPPRRCIFFIVFSDGRLQSRPSKFEGKKHTCEKRAILCFYANSLLLLPPLFERLFFFHLSPTSFPSLFLS